MQTRLAALVSALSLLALGGCALNAPYTADLGTQGVWPPSPMVAKPLPRTLVVVVNPDKVADAFPVENTPHAVKGFRAFFEKSLQQTLAPYFEKIIFVASGAAVPAEPHIVANVHVDGIEADSHSSGRIVNAMLKMQWAFALRPSESASYLFSYADVAQSEVSYASGPGGGDGRYTLDTGCRQTMMSAMHGLLEGWTKRDVHGKLRDFVEAGSAPTPAPTETAGKAWDI